MDTSAVTEAVRATSTRHLIHRPRTWNHAAAVTGAEEFVLSGELPVGHPLFNDGPGEFHDVQAAAELVREAAEFIGPQHFGIPEDRTGLFYQFAIDATDVSSWRADGGHRQQLTMAMTVTPAKVINNVPRALDFHVELDIDDRPAGVATAQLVFLSPIVTRNHRGGSREGALRAADWRAMSARTLDSQAVEQRWPGHGVDSPGVCAATHTPAHRLALAVPYARPGDLTTPLDPVLVGRHNPGNVLLHDACEDSGGRLGATVSIPADHPLRPSGSNSPVPSSLLLEAVRQTSLLAAHRTHRAEPERLALTSVSAHVRGYAEPELPMHCTAIAGPALAGLDGDTQIPLTLTVSQQHRVVLEATTTVTNLH